MSTSKTTAPSIDGVEPDVIRHLGEALAGLAKANQATKYGTVSNHCLSALREIQKALRAASYIDSLEPEQVTND
jgi:hypothetical protein